MVGEQRGEMTFLEAGEPGHLGERQEVPCGWSMGWCGGRGGSGWGLHSGSEPACAGGSHQHCEGRPHVSDRAQLCHWLALRPQAAHGSSRGRCLHLHSEGPAPYSVRPCPWVRGAQGALWAGGGDEGSLGGGAGSPNFDFLQGNPFSRVAWNPDRFHLAPGLGSFEGSPGRPSPPAPLTEGTQPRPPPPARPRLLGCSGTAESQLWQPLASSFRPL